MALTDTQVKALKPTKSKRKVSDADGLYVEVLPTGRKTFRYRWRAQGKEKDIRLGQVEFMRLASARRLRDTARELLDRGEDPSEVLAKVVPKAPAPVAERNRPDAWDKIADRYVEYRRRRGANWKTVKKLERQVLATIEAFGSKPVCDIMAADIIDLVQPIEADGRIEVAHELRARIGHIMDFAEAAGYPNTNPASKIGGVMMPRTRGRWPGLTDPKDVGKLMRDIRSFDRCEPETRWGLLLSAYLFPRSEQIRGATWDEIDIENAMWEIPGQRMKGTEGRDQLVPLPRQALELLDEISGYTGGTGYVVPSPRGPNLKLSDMVFNIALRRMGYDTKTMHCHHGFRTTASTNLNEMGFNRDWIERQLSHVEKDNVRAAYNKAQYIQGRTEMMQTYADWLDEVEAGTREDRPTVARP